MESLGLRRPQLAGRDLARIARRLRRGLAPPRAVDGLHVLAPLVAPLHGHAAVRALNRALLRAQVGRAARRLGIERPILWAYVPQAEVLLDTLRPAVVVYHCVDDIAAQAGVDEASFRAAERRFAARADLVLASAPALAARMREILRSSGRTRPTSPTRRCSRAPWSRSRPTPPWRRCRGRGSCSPARSSPRSWT